MAEFQLAMNEFDVLATTTDVSMLTPFGPPCRVVPSFKAFQNHWFGSTHKNDKSSSGLTFHCGTFQSFFNPSHPVLV
jgi:hypothetical protein